MVGIYKHMIKMIRVRVANHVFNINLSGTPPPPRKYSALYIKINCAKRGEGWGAKNEHLSEK